jgi:O-antigen ligase/Tfp pilus assembly protein PilF
MFFNFLLALFLVITPIFGKSIDYQESIILYAAIMLFFLFSRFRRSPAFILHKKFIFFEAILIFLYIISTIFAKNIGFSYYGFFRFLFTLTLLNLCLTNLKDTLLSKLIHYSSLIYALVFLLNKFNLIQLLPRPFYDNFILQIWGHSYLADIIIMAIPVVIYQLIYQTHLGLKNKLFHLFSIILLLSILILTNSRSGAISLIIGSTYLLIPKIKNIFKPLILLLVIFLIAYFTNQFLYLQESTLKSPGGNRLEYWKQALLGFVESPILGNGPNNFFYLNKKYQSEANSNTNYAHNYFLESLALNGFPYTLIFFGFIIFSLKYQLHRHPLNFSIGLTALVNTLLDPAWNSLGIFCLSLFYIFYQNPNVVIRASKSTSQKTFSLFNLTLFIFMCLYYLTKTTADILYINNQRLTSFRFDPFNLDNPVALDPKFLKFTISTYSNNVFLYRELTRITPLPESEKYYHQLFLLSPKENLSQYYQLANYYFSQNKSYELNQLLSLIKKNIIPAKYSQQETIPLTKLYYQVALSEWNNHQFESAINNFQNALNFSVGWANFHIELANAYWAIDQKDLAINQLQVECQKIPLSSDICQKYLLENKNQLPPPGALQTSINSIDIGYLPLSNTSLQRISDYRQFIKNTPLPQSEDYYYQIFAINPRENFDLYYELANYYYNQSQFDKLTNLLYLINDNINTDKATKQQTFPLARIYYQIALIKWQDQHFDQAINFFQIAIRFSQDSPDFHIELANAYWAIDQKDLAINQLQVECQKIPLSSDICQKYLLENKNQLPPPGALQTSINSIDIGYLPLSNTSLQRISDYRQFIKNTPLPQSEDYYYQIFAINPRENFDLYYELANYYYNQSQFDKLTNLLSFIITQNIDTKKIPMDDGLPLAKIYYHVGLQKWQQKQFDQSIYYFKQAILFSRSWSDFHIELANAYWAIDQKDLAIKQLNNSCQTWPVSYSYCREYLTKYKDNFLPPGTSLMLKRIEDISPYQSYTPGQI